MQAAMECPHPAARSTGSFDCSARQPASRPPGRV